ncbi:MAG: hypothetical protein ACREVV_07940 [Steroidobacteraceae bacterium]
MLSLAEQFGFAIIEDDVYGDLHDGPAVRLAQIDGLRHVIHVGPLGTGGDRHPF